MRAGILSKVFPTPVDEPNFVSYRLRLSATETVFSVVPAFVRLYRSVTVAAVDKALLMGFHVPCWAIAYVVGHDARYWYRLQQGQRS